MARTTYTFRSEWLVPVPAASLYDLLEDVAGYPAWWPQVRAVAKVEAQAALVVCRSLLPYTLHVEVRPQVQDREAGVLRAALDGDLVGSSSWRLEPVAAGTRTVFEQRVTTRGAVLGAAGRFARPVLEANHQWMMRGALRGLGGRSAR